MTGDRPSALAEALNAALGLSLATSDEARDYLRNRGGWAALQTWLDHADDDEDEDEDEENDQDEEAVAVTGRTSRMRARDALPAADSTPRTELEHLADVVRELRATFGLSQDALARRAIISKSTVQRLEKGAMRPRRSLLMAVAHALDPDDRAGILEQLVTAAGSSMAPDSPGSERYRRRRMERGWLTGDVPLPAVLERAISLHRQADEAWKTAMALLDSPGAGTDAHVLGEAARLLAESRRLRDEAGPPIGLAVDGREVVFGMGVQ